MFNPITYLKEVLQEIKHVSWPSAKQTAGKTTLVLVASLLIGIYMGLLDTTFSWVLAQVVTQ